MRKQPLWLAGILLLAGLLIGRTGNAPAATSDYTVLLQWGDQAPAGQFNAPMGVAVDAEGNVYVADKDNARVQKFTADGEFVTAWGSLGNDAGQFAKPTRLAADESLYVYVIDQYHARVQKFTTDGVFLETLGNQEMRPTEARVTSLQRVRLRGNDDEGISSPQDIAVDDEGNVYVVDGGRVKKFARDGTFATKWGSPGSGPGQFNEPGPIAVDRQGHVYVADSHGGQGRVQKFTSEGTYLTGWLSPPIDVGFRYPVSPAIRGITVDREGYVYVTADSYIQKSTTDGSFVAMWPGLDAEAGERLAGMWLYGIAADLTGYLYVTGDYHRLRKFTADGTLIAQWGGLGKGDQQLYNAQAIDVDAQGNVYVGSGNTGFYPYGRIQKFDNHGNFLLSFGSYCNLQNGDGCVGSGDGQFWGVHDITVDGGGNIYILDWGNLRVLKYAPDGTYLRKWGEGELDRTMGIAADAEGYVYVTYWGGNQQVRKYRGDGTFITGWGSYGSGEGQLNGPGRIAVDAAGHVYVADRFNYRVQKFDSTGHFLRAWGSQGGEAGQFNQPFDVAVDGDGYVYVGERHNQRVQKFTPDGTFVTAWGSRGAGPGQFSDQIALAADGEGHVFVLDKVLNRVQKFGPGQPASATPTATATAAATWTSTPTATATATVTLTATPTETSEPTGTPTMTVTPARTPADEGERKVYLPLLRNER